MNRRLQILFVCAMNKQRSVTAELLYRNDARLEVRSAGVRFDANRRVSEEDLRWADVVFAMEREHKLWIATRFEGLELMAYATDTIHRAVYVQLPNGIKIPNTVKAITQITDFVGTGTQIEFDLAWPSIIDAASNPIISWMPVWRLASDTMIFTWATNTVCDVQFAMRTLENLPSEN